MWETERNGNPARTEEIRKGQKELEEEVLAAGLCTGCGACVHLCPYQACWKDRTVTLHPCDLAQGRCYLFCPRTPADLSAMQATLYDPADLTPELGAVKDFCIARAADGGVRRRGQHGGTVSALVALALREGMIDAAVLTGEGEGMLPRPATVRDPEAALGLGKSRFVVSPTVSEFNRTLRGEARRIGVVATPCQALALAKMRLEPLSAAESGMEKLKLVVGLFCGWALDWRRLSGLLAKRLDVTGVSGMDIPPSVYHTLEVTAGDDAIRIPLEEVLPCVRDACRTCTDMTAEFSDLSVGSARLPEGWEEARHWNQVIVRTARGAELLELARRRGVLEFREVPAGNLERLQAASLRKKRQGGGAPKESREGGPPQRQLGGAKRQGMRHARDGNGETDGLG